VREREGGRDRKRDRDRDRDRGLGMGAATTMGDERAEKNRLYCTYYIAGEMPKYNICIPLLISWRTT
jgi:hypothetical protein